MKPETKSFYELAVQHVVERIVAGLDDALDLQALARVAALSPFHFHRVFRGLVGETPLELHRRLRMERAAWTLLHEDTPVTTIAFAAGYETHESFTRAFRANYGRSPSDFRNARQADQSGCVRPPQIQLPSRTGLHHEPGLARIPLIRFVPPGGMHMDVEIKVLPEKRVASVSHTGPYDRISEAFARLGSLVGPAGLIGAGTEMLAIYHDDPESTPPADLKSEAGIVVPGAAKLPAGLDERRLPAGRYARTTHLGSYERLGDTWSRFMGEWLPRSGHRAADNGGNTVSFEIYRNTPQDTPKDKLITELYVLLA